MQQENLITDGGMKIPTITLAPMGMVSPWRCQELQIFVSIDKCLHPLGNGVNNFKTSKNQLL